MQPRQSKQSHAPYVCAACYHTWAPSTPSMARSIGSSCSSLTQLTSSTCPSGSVCNSKAARNVRHRGADGH